MKAIIALVVFSMMPLVSHARGVDGSVNLLADVDVTITFPATETGSRNHVRYDLTAPADASMFVTAMALDGTNYWVESNCLGELPKATSCYVDVVFEPTEAKDYSSTLLITTSVDTHTVHLTGTATAPVPKPPRLE